MLLVFAVSGCYYEVAHTFSILASCQKACKKCDIGRPCLRCIRFRIADSCRDSVRKERSRGLSYFSVFPLMSCANIHQSARVVKLEKTRNRPQKKRCRGPQMHLSSSTQIYTLRMTGICTTSLGEIMLNGPFLTLII